MRYEYEGEGLIMEEQAPETPFADDPLETLKRGKDGI
jgi:hypothetical protein